MLARLRRLPIRSRSRCRLLRHLSSGSDSNGTSKPVGKAPARRKRVRAAWMSEWKRPSLTEMALDDTNALPPVQGKLSREDYEMARSAIEETLTEMGYGTPVQDTQQQQQQPPALDEQQQEESALDQHRISVAQTKVEQWRRRFEDTWKSEDNEIFGEHTALEERLKADPDDDDAKIKRKLLDDLTTQSSFYRAMIIEALPKIADNYTREAKDWGGREMEQLDIEIDKVIGQHEMKEYARAWFERDPLRKLSLETQQKMRLPPLPVRLSTLLEHIDPQLRQTNKEIGPDDAIDPMQHEMIDMSNPARVMEVLASKGYRFSPDGGLEGVDREAFALDPDQRRLLREGVDSRGNRLSDNRLRIAIKETLQLSSAALRVKINNIMHWAFEQSRMHKTPVPTKEQLLENPEELPKELRPTIEDLDPDARPPKETFSETFDACPLCSKPRNVRAKCYNPPPDIVTHTNIELLSKFVNEFGMILPRRESALCAKYQRKVAKMIKRSRELGLMPYDAKLKFRDKNDTRDSFELHDLYTQMTFEDSRSERQSSFNAQPEQVGPEPDDRVEELEPTLDDSLIDSTTSSVPIGSSSS